MIRSRYAAKAEAVQAALIDRGFERRVFALHAERGGELAVWFWIHRAQRKCTEVYVTFDEIDVVGLDRFADWLAARVRRAPIQPCPIACAGDGMVGDFSFTVTLGAERVENQISAELERKRNAEFEKALFRHGSL